MLNGGDLNIGGTPQDQLKSDFLFQALQMMNYDAFTPGESEFTFGWEYLNEKARENPIFISANIIDAKTQKPVFPPYLSKTYNYSIETVDAKGKPKTLKEKVNIAVVGVLGKSVVPAIDSYLGNEHTMFTYEEPTTALIKLMPEIRKKNDIVVVLAHVTQAEADAIARGVAGIDILLTGHDGIQMAGNPLLVGRTVMGTNGDRGRFVGELELRFDENKHIINYRGKEIALSGDYADDSSMANLVQTYKSALQSVPPH